MKPETEEILRKIGIGEMKADDLPMYPKVRFTEPDLITLIISLGLADSDEAKEVLREYQKEKNGF